VTTTKDPITENIFTFAQKQLDISTNDLQTNYSSIMSEQPHASNTSLSNGAGDSNPLSNRNTSDTEAPQAASAEDSNSNGRGDLDPPYSFFEPLTPAMGFVQSSRPAGPPRTSDGTGQESPARDPQGNATFVDEVLDLAARQFCSQSNGRNTNTSNTEAPQAAAEDSNTDDSNRPSIFVNTLLQEATAAEGAIFEPATPAQVMGLDRLTLDPRFPNSKGTDAPQAASTEDSKEPQNVANPTQGNTSIAHINGPDVMKYYDMDAASRNVTGAVEKNSSEETSSTPASSLLGPGNFDTKDL
jgi:hypothetical protein